VSDILILDDARSRGLNLPSDDGVAQDLLDEAEARLAAAIGPLVGERVETFYVGISRTDGKLGLRRATDAVVVTDGALTTGPTVDASYYRLIDSGASVRRTYVSPQRYWTGPYVTATYTPNDYLRVQSVLYDLAALHAEPVDDRNSERIGDYSYSRGVSGGPTRQTIEAALISSLLPKRDPADTILAVSRPLYPSDAATVINLPEIEVFP
jgi:hypothetical protein